MVHRSSSTGAGVSNGAREKGYDAPAVVLIVGLLLSVSRKPRSVPLSGPASEMASLPQRRTLLT